MDVLDRVTAEHDEIRRVADGDTPRFVPVVEPLRRRSRECREYLAIVHAGFGQQRVLATRIRIDRGEKHRSTDRGEGDETSPRAHDSEHDKEPGYALGLPRSSELCKGCGENALELVGHGHDLDIGYAHLDAQSPSPVAIMKHTPHRALAVLALIAVPSAASQETAETGIDAAIARAAFEQVRTIALEDGGELWGLALDFPILFVHPDTRVVVADRKDGAGELSEWQGLWTGRFPAERGIANFSTEWAGVRWTMLVWPPPTDEVERARLLIHESFHNAQPALGITASSQPCAHLATFDGRLWMRLEARALATALESDPYDGSREEAAADALLFRALRRSLFAESADAEDALERLEGSAEYTGNRLYSPIESVRTAATVAKLNGLATRPTLTRSFQYATGPALGLLLDGYDPLWREDFLAGRAMSDLLDPAIQFEAPNDVEAEALRRAKKHGFEQIAAEETERERKREERLAQHRARFLEGPILILPTRSANRSFDPNKIDLLEGVGSVYGTVWISVEWGVADAPGGALIRNDLHIHLAAPTDVEGPQLAGDGWTLELDPGWTVVPGERDGDFELVEKEG